MAQYLLLQGLDGTKETMVILGIQGDRGDTMETHGTMGIVTQQGFMEPRSQL